MVVVVERQRRGNKGGTQAGMLTLSVYSERKTRESESCYTYTLLSLLYFLVNLHQVLPVQFNFSP